MRKIISEGYAIFRVFRYIVIRQPEFRSKVQNLLLSDDGLVVIGKQIKNNKTLCISQGVFLYSNVTVYVVECGNSFTRFKIS